jgi:hypothetical protein
MLAVVPSSGADPNHGETMSYREAKEFLARHTQVVELTNGKGAHVAVCPQWQGRVMTSSCGGLEGASFGYIHRQFIEQGQPNPHFSNYGAEERMWLSPEGGPFSLWFQPGAAQNLDNWFTPPALNEGAWECRVEGPDRVRMTCTMRLTNASATQFQLGVTRDVRLFDGAEFGRLFGDAAARLVSQAGVSMVAYETANTITNQGAPMSKEKGLLSVWILGMMNAGPATVIIVPYRAGSEAELGPVVKSDYFGEVPADRLKVTPEAILFVGDNHYRSKIGTSQRRAKNVLGSIDYQGNVLTLVNFSMPDDPTKHDYMNNMWQIPQPQPYEGDVVNSYNDGPPAPGKPGLGAFYEIESLSPAQSLATNGSLTHCHRTVHIHAAMPVLAQLAKQVLGVDLAAVRKEMGK